MGNETQRNEFTGGTNMFCSHSSNCLTKADRIANVTRKSNKDIAKSIHEINFFVSILICVR